jgi:two-component system sensor histidine kinase GlrK
MTLASSVSTVFSIATNIRVAVMRLPLFWRLALGSLAIILVVAGVNIYALTQLRQLAALSNELVSSHTPAIDTAKRLITSLNAQLRSEKKYRALPDAVFLNDFEEEAEEFRRSITALQDQEASADGKRLLEDAERSHNAYRSLFHEAIAPSTRRSHAGNAAYASRRDALITEITERLDAHVDLHEAMMRTIVGDSQARSAQAESIASKLVLLALLLGLGLAGIASYSILRPLHRVQEHIRQIGQGKFGLTVDVRAPSDLRELVDTVNWMGNKLQELDDMKAEFLANISHELRTPLASIREGTQLLLDEIPGPLSPAQRETLQIMKDSSQRLIRLISTLLDLSKMEAGLMDYHIVRSDLTRVVETSVSKVRFLAEGKRIQLVTDLPTERLWVPMDGTRIEQVVDNLLSNALKFSPEGAAITLSLESDPKGEGVRLSVSDAGPGIAPEDLPHIFERFYQGRTHSKNVAAGSGLGLALAKKVVEAHRGRIWVESEIGKGTSVRFVLPAKL